ncbi:MerR family transcriptional regulator [Noviherbaspirillum sp. Root189]|uniref:MerR family transcriptional regulator n=1 Tax=Noviherbaspirillum sp. Root189 TaxID=1736487 RepID=UPI00070DE569|nr:MerR family transcriptional regulator [Noviherbaspirillum sp. Root189]KRB79174.1 hypothetical protein ASE07_05735 [Noviherbaspirillum sp. Root189]
MLLKIGELAKRTGLTVRTLHHYDAIGLLSPSVRSDAGYRLYNRNDIERLHRIQALRRLELPLAEVATLLEGDVRDFDSVIQQQIASLDREVERTVALRERLKELRKRLAEKEEPDLNDWLATLEMMTLYGRYFTQEEFAALRTAEADMKELTALVVTARALMQRGVPPDSDEAVALAKPWLTLSLRHMGDDPRLILKLDAMHRNEMAVQVLTGVDVAMLEYMVHATAEFRLRLYEKHLGKEQVARIREPYLAHYRNWPLMFAEARELHERGVSPSSPELMDLCKRWIDTFHAIWGTDPALCERVRELSVLEPDLMAGSGMDEAVMHLVQQGIATLAKQSK